MAAAADAAAGDTHDRNKTVLLGKPKKKDPIDQIAALLTSVSHVERCGLPRQQARPARWVGGTFCARHRYFVPCELVGRL